MNLRIAILLLTTSSLIAGGQFEVLQAYDKSVTEFRESVAAAELSDAKDLSLKML